jgi:hypothetical protein
MQAAAELGAPLQLLTFVSIDDSLARPEDIARLPELLSRSFTGRAASDVDPEAPSSPSPRY